MRQIEVTPYSERWSVMFEEEANSIQKIFGDEILEIHHIGSTSVPGLHAKPTIDIMPVVKKITLVDELTVEMISIGYEPKGENGMQGRRYFRKGGDRRTHHVHFYEFGNPQIERHIVFRDYLRTHPKDAQRYGVLKQALAKQFTYDAASYVKGKEALGLEIDRLAMKWYKASK
ncbi:GrpB family protein [Alicyclobacillus fodiniaquatilis]|uniref:GrpB family protein n=1 Tax=Alicyclobacillus fodiniaquatilis TaxID=1661150 RepID=A0ABW4JD84_9BACL